MLNALSKSKLKRIAHGKFEHIEFLQKCILIWELNINKKQPGNHQVWFYFHHLCGGEVPQVLSLSCLAAQYSWTSGWVLGGEGVCPYQDLESHHFSC